MRRFSCPDVEKVRISRASRSDVQGTEEPEEVIGGGNLLVGPPDDPFPGTRADPVLAAFLIEHDLRHRAIARDGAIDVLPHAVELAEHAAEAEVDEIAPADRAFDRYLQLDRSATQPEQIIRLTLSPGDSARGSAMAMVSRA